AWVLNKNGMSTKDVTVVNLEPDAAAQAFLAGQNDAAVTYEPFISAVREKSDQGHILVTTLDYPMVLDTVGCTPEFLKANPDAAKALADSYFEALDLIKSDPAKSYESMGADVKQSAKEFEE
ncbi:MAG: ABC transporter permease, partial [Mesorhizobium sp.]